VIEKRVKDRCPDKKAEGENGTWVQGRPEAGFFLWNALAESLTPASQGSIGWNALKRDKNCVNRDDQSTSNLKIRMSDAIDIWT